MWKIFRWSHHRVNPISPSVSSIEELKTLGKNVEIALRLKKY
jgi:hypothetical protein